jgi:hypothetical protein
MNVPRIAVARGAIALLLSTACHHGNIPGQNKLDPSQVRGRTVVSMSPPDTMADWVSSSSNWVTNTTQIAGMFVKDLVLIRFVAGATQQQRQEAVDRIGGTVVGGVPFYGGVEGVYYVQLPADPTNERVFAAIDTLNAQPQVENALPDLILDEDFAYRTPVDGTGMRRADWHLDPAMLVAVGAPASAQRAPACESRYDMSDMVEPIFDAFVNGDAASIREARGILRQSPSARRGVLRDNEACARLRAAMHLLFASRKELIPPKTDFDFFQLGDYAGVFLNFPVDPKNPVVSGTKPLYVFARREQHEGHGKTGGDRAKREGKYTYIAELRF